MNAEVEVREAWDLKSHDSWALAVAAGKHKSREKICPDLVNGSTVVGYYFYGDLLVLKFSNGKFLEVFPGVGCVDWRIVDDKTACVGSTPPDEVILVYEKGEKVNWQWKAILDSFVGKQTAISPSDQCLFFFYRGGVEYMISVLVEVHSPNGSILFFAEC